MRALLVAVALLSAGCVAPALTSNSVVLPEAQVPAGATVETIEGGLRLVFERVTFPFEVNVTIPEGTTMVRATGLVAEDLGVSVSLRHAETLRRRCNFAPVDAWDAPVRGEASCTGVTLVDALPAVWQARGFSTADAGRVEIDLLTTPLDGILAELDVSQLSMREHALEKTTAQMVPSFDGTPLYVEVTKPQGEGPWPTIVWSSPYNWDDRIAGIPSAWNYFVNDWAQRGYAVVSADVRGYADSEGCVEVWGPREQKDQTFLVEWVAKQDWSDGTVGFYGQSYVATTPVEAAIDAPEALKAIIAVAPVSDAYNDWHFGGVPNGENLMSPLAYQTLGGQVPFPGLGLANPETIAGSAGTLPTTLSRADNGFCDPTVTLRPNDPRAVYDDFYVERNFSARAGDVTAAVLYTQGFEDSNVKSALIPDFFAAIQAPKLGLFGHWVHQHPTRADNEALFLLWFDQYVKGKPVGFDALPPVRVLTNAGTERVAAAWPDPGAPRQMLNFDLDAGALTGESGKGSASLFLDSTRTLVPDELPDVRVLPSLLWLDSEPLAEPLILAGQAQVHVSATLRHAQNAYVSASLYEVDGDTSKLVTWGMFNLAHRHGHERYEPVQPGERMTFGIPLLPTEWVFAPGTKLHLELRGASVNDWSLVQPIEPGMLDVDAAGSMLEVPLAEAGARMPATAQR